MVDHPLTLTYCDLTTMPLFEQYVTIQCVSNEVGGDLVGNAKWTGVHLRDVLAAAGVQTGATQLVGRSVDGFTAGFPTAHAMDPVRDPMIALAMNDEPLPVIHGYPARLIIPGLYGYVSATKWLSEIQMTTLEAFDGYWIPLGWSKLGPILTQSRIDVPRNGQSLQAGPVTIAGVAWAPDRGISKVEVSVDQGAWLTCTLSGPISKAVWVQWRVPWTATPGPALDRGPGDRRERRRADRRRHPTGARRRARPPHDQRLGELSAAPPAARAARPDQLVRVTFVRPAGESGSKPALRATASASSWPGRMNASGLSASGRSNARPSVRPPVRSSRPPMSHGREPTASTRRIAGSIAAPIRPSGRRMSVGIDGPARATGPCSRSAVE